MNHNFPYVSVIIPVFNIEEYLPQCLESLSRQSYQNFEVLCVDDASSDGSAAVVEAYEKRDSRVHLLRKEHGGVSAARNHGIRQARGQYILFFDGDDWPEADMLSELVSAAEASQADVTVCSACVHCDAADRRTQRRLNSLRRELTVSDHLWEAEEDPRAVWMALAQAGSWPFVWNKLIRTDLLREHEILFSEQLQLGEDGLFLQILFQYARRIKFIKPALYHYRYQRKSSATVRLFQQQLTRFDQHLRILQNLCCELHRRNKLEENRLDLLRWMIIFLYDDFVRLPAPQQPVASREIRLTLLTHGLMGQGQLLDRVSEKRLRILCDTKSAPTKLGRVCCIIKTKIENRVSKLLSRNVQYRRK